METLEQSLVCKYKIKHYIKQSAFWFRSVIHSMVNYEFKNRLFSLHVS